MAVPPIREYVTRIRPASRFFPEHKVVVSEFKTSYSISRRNIDNNEVLSELIVQDRSKYGKNYIYKSLFPKNDRFCIENEPDVGVRNYFLFGPRRRKIPQKKVHNSIKNFASWFTEYLRQDGTVRFQFIKPYKNWQ